MTSEVAIQVQGVSKKYCRFLKRTLIYGVRDVVKDVLGVQSPSNELRRDEFWALKDVSFEVKRGECLGMIGANGAGKSTLLKLLNGVILPDTGTIRVHGRVGGLLELGAGFHPMLTGRENIHLSGAVLGLNKKEMEQKFEEIVDFAGLWEFIDTPIKYYSSGMYVRLGFSVAIHSEPEILVIDEALAVGDAYFVQKCFTALEQFQKQGFTILFVSHDMNAIRRYCQETIWLDGGSLIQRGEPKVIIDLYNGMIFERIAAKSLQTKLVSTQEFAARNSTGDTHRFGTATAEIVSATLLDAQLNAVDTVTSGVETTFKIRVRFSECVNDAVFGITIRDKRGVEMYGTNTLWKNSIVEPCKSGDVVEISFKQKLLLGQGEYFVNVAVNEKRAGGLVRLDWMADVIKFSVMQDDVFLGSCNLSSEISIQFI